MSVGILVITHEDTGAQLVSVASTIFEQPAIAISLVSVPADLEPAVLGKYADLIHDAIKDRDNGQGVLVLTDVYGATPDNLARYFSRDYNARVVSGINLPMLLRVLNYPQQPLEQMCETALEGGRSGIQLEQE